MAESLIGNTPQRRPGVLGVHSLDHFSFAAPDLAEASRFYENFGLDVRPEGDHLALYTFNHPHRWGLVTSGARKKFAHLTFGVFEDDLDAFRARLKQLNVETMTPPPGSNGFWLRDPDGNAIELAVKQKSSPTEKSVFVMPSAPAGVHGATLRSQAPRTRPRRLSHIAIFTPDVLRAVKFYASVLGLRLSDRSHDFVAFMHGPHGSEHHMIALLKSNGPGLHHCSWDVGSVNDIGNGAANMAAHGFAGGWGLGRHVLGANYFHYVRDPWGSYSEYSADMDYIPETVDWQAGDHDPEDSMSLWGPVPPADFITNFEVIS